MFRVIRLRVHSYHKVYHFLIPAILESVGGRVILEAVDNVEMKDAVDIDCVLIGSWLTRIVTTLKLSRKLSKFRKYNVNVDILWSV